MVTEIDLIFTGNFKNIHLSSLLYFFRNSNSSYFSSPEISTVLNEDETINIILTTNYVDYVISSKEIKIADSLISDVFVNLGKDDENLELLLFFNLKDLQKENYKTAMDELQAWSVQFRDNYGFANVKCQIDNGNENEYYFFNSSLGPLYTKINR